MFIAHPSHFLDVADFRGKHFEHRLDAGVGEGDGPVRIETVVREVQRERPVVLRLALAAGLLFPIQAIVGGIQILTGLSGWSQTLHLALGAIPQMPKVIHHFGYFPTRTAAGLANHLYTQRYLQ